MKHYEVATNLTIALFTIALCAKLSAQQTAVTINLTEQTAYLLEDGRVAFVSPIASGKEGQESRSGARVMSKDLHHQSGKLQVWSGEVRFNKGLIVWPQPNRGRQSGKSIDGRPLWERSVKTLTLRLDAREP